MTKPPKTPPHSDIDGVHEDERRNVDVAIETGQDSGDLEQATKGAIGRPALDKAGKKGTDRAG